MTRLYIKCTIKYYDKVRKIFGVRDVPTHRHGHGDGDHHDHGDGAQNIRRDCREVSAAVTSGSCNDQAADVDSLLGKGEQV